MLALHSVAPLSLAVAADPRHGPLLSWMAQQGATLGPVVLGKSRCGAGYGAFASRDVAEGEELFISYLTEDDLEKPTSARRALLQSKYNFLCGCGRCEPG